LISKSAVRHIVPLMLIILDYFLEILLFLFDQTQTHQIMTEDAQFVLDSTEENMGNALSHLEREFHKIRAGKASPSMLYGVLVEYYGTTVPIEQTSNINTPDPRQIIVQPFDKSSIHAIEKAIMAANLGFNPQNEGEMLRINVPPLTEERRKDLVKRSKSEAEDAKISIRNARRQGNDEAKKLEKEGLPEDETKRLIDKIQELTDKYIQEVDKLLGIKEKDIMTV
jgi:ribosome recycling factor